MIPSIQKKKYFPLCLLIFLIFSLLPRSVQAKTETLKPLNEEEFQTILQRYTLVEDFEPKNPTRVISDELFWKYPFKIPPIEFPVTADINVDKEDIVATPGSGREIEHLNFARKLFYEGNLDHARDILLSARARYGKDHPFHRRVDMYLGIIFLHLGIQSHNETQRDKLIRKTNYNNAATFMAWALVNKKDVADPEIDKIATKYFYRLALVYYQFERYVAAYNVANEALNYLRKSNRNEFRPLLYWLIAEIEIKNHTYLEALTSLDRAIRIDPNPELAPALFARIADIYFNFNNYELAEDMYGLSLKVAKDQKKILSEELILRGEALFWLGKFDEAKKLFEYALANPGPRSNQNPRLHENFSLAALRSADASLATKKYEDARLGYFQVRSYYPQSNAAVVGDVRRACLELPEYKGNNVKHARELLDNLKGDLRLTTEAQELDYSCYVASFTQRERTADMLEKIRGFYLKYPESRFLKNMIPPLKEFQAKKFFEYMAQNDYHSALAFYHENKQRLFDKPNADVDFQLFKANFYTYQSVNGQEFYPAFEKLEPKSDIKLLVSAIYFAELVTAKNTDKQAQRQNVEVARQLSAKKALDLPYNPKLFQLLMRLVALKSSDPHLEWIYRLAQSWQVKQPELMCLLSYPVVSRMFDVEPKNEAVVTKIFGLINLTLQPKEHPICLAQLLELEMKALSHFPDLLAARYEERLIKNVDEVIASYYWQVANILIDAGKVSQGEKFLQHIIDSAPKTAPEVAYAQIQLDKTKSVTEKLWNGRVK